MDTGDRAERSALFPVKHPPGQYVEVDGQRLHLFVRGTGPTVVLCGGLGSNWFDWNDTVDILSAHHHVIVLDRPGFGLSDPLPVGATPTVRGEADRIIGVLDALGVTEPAVVAGHSIAGFYAEAVARLYPSRIRGILLLDSSAESDPRRFVPAVVRIEAAHVIATALSKTGLQKLVGPRVRRVLNQATPPDGTPQETFDWVDDIYRRPTYLAAALVEDVVYPDLAVELNKLRKRSPLVVPVIVAAAHTGRPSPWGKRWIKTQRKLASYLRADFTVVMPAHHHAMIDKPAEVAALITELV
ncbi:MULTISPECIES: alpha/beta fold hydrolase [unclassified Rhodococcus (in: high G+C Gram-positive bacteria)]|uniref:alpha/beta fold hydrolase n=1 Tax=unclassified Rhodococcus (in: high G+C Gram-positive bacteria) TaxID=192944 RepID=UPI0015C58F6A|nr:MULTISPECIES: alpha/beta hydrolase [unclassified Rhodococcus (in: high G+C Gram-positive bacteria)]